MSVTLTETYESRTPDTDGWRGVPFRHPRMSGVDVGVAGGSALVVTQADGGKHDGGPMPPEAPRDPQPGDDGKCAS